jgi:hypothetical protein
MKTFFTLRDYTKQERWYGSRWRWRAWWAVALERTTNKANSLGMTFGHWRDICWIAKNANPSLDLLQVQLYTLPPCMHANHWNSSREKCKSNTMRWRFECLQIWPISTILPASINFGLEMMGALNIIRWSVWNRYRTNLSIYYIMLSRSRENYPVMDHLLVWLQNDGWQLVLASIFPQWVFLLLSTASWVCCC